MPECTGKRGNKNGNPLLRSLFTWCRSAAPHGRRAVTAAAGWGVITVLTVGLPAVSPAAAVSAVLGLDVSDHEPAIDWTAAVSEGAQFAYVKATEGTAFVSPDFASQYNGAYQAGLIRGSYHFARPDESTGAAQASFFVTNGGGWSADGRTLPGALDIENNPHGAECYGLSQSAMVSWIASFDDTYHALTSVWPVIYTPPGWWATCTGDYGGFASQSPLWLPTWGTGGTTLPGGWSSATFSQYATAGTFPGDQDMFNGSSSQLTQFATDG
jgi:GH25 family lysozyme M1 (1,4-beta-N-acetylmuramidase)